MLSEYRKLAVAVATFLSLAVANGLVDGTAAVWVNVILGVLGSYGVYAAPNSPSILVEWDLPLDADPNEGD